MIVSADHAALTAAAFAHARQLAPRTRERRAACHLWVALSETKSVDAARRALAGFAAPDVEAAAVELLGRLALAATTTAKGTTAT